MNKKERKRDWPTLRVSHPLPLPTHFRGAPLPQLTHRESNFTVSYGGDKLYDNHSSSPNKLGMPTGSQRWLCMWEEVTSATAGWAKVVKDLVEFFFFFYLLFTLNVDTLAALKAEDSSWPRYKRKTWDKTDTIHASSTVDYAQLLGFAVIVTTSMFLTWSPFLVTFIVTVICRKS